MFETSNVTAINSQLRRQQFLAVLEQGQYSPLAPLASVGTLITDQQAPADLLARYREAGLTVLS